MKKQAVNPTKQHSMKCPKLYGKKCTCDGYHTFEELYEHRIVLWIALCNALGQANHSNDQAVWKSKLHSDGTSFEGWFILGMNKDKGKQITYHIPMKYWEECYFEELKKAPQFDNHTSDDVLERIKDIK